MLHGTKWRARQSLLSHLIIFLFENPRKTNNISQLWLVGAKRLNKKRWRSSCLVQLDKRGRGKEEEEVMDDGEEEAVHVMRIAPSRLTELPLLENDACFGTIGCGNLANGGLARAHGMAFLFQPLHLKQYLKMHSAVIFTIIQRI